MDNEMVVFDAYHKWMGIPAAEQPADFYRLLGLARFESDPDVIDAAANKQMAYLRGCAKGDHADQAEEMLNEVARARLCLLNEQQKSVYDADLSPGLPSTPNSDSPPTVVDVSEPPIELFIPASSHALSTRVRSVRKRKTPFVIPRKRKIPFVIPAVILVGITGLALVLFYGLKDIPEAEPAVTGSPADNQLVTDEHVSNVETSAPVASVDLPEPVDTTRTISILVTVASNQNWKSFADVEEGDSLVISASGMWHTWPGGGEAWQSDADGTLVYAGSSFPLPGYYQGQLIGKIGSRVFAVGCNCEIDVESRGTLQLMNNDDNRRRDNRGSLSVRILRSRR